ncbi:atrial natriuretic peptide receptor 1 [Aplysia californica]|uniref:Guanylate cyclase n=1 Tax=Aplysia californica TaxID=6500 RepID=A0ABM1VTX6_APLCA|nr:atrial natriuretic peptide receptor 1 [Aplysia californica]
MERITGNVKVDANGDREPDYWMWDMAPGTDNFSVILEARMTAISKQKIFILGDIVWQTADGSVPLDVPVCGFFSELCPVDLTERNTIIIVAVIVLASLIATGMAVTWYIRKMKREKELDQMLWQILYQDIRFTKSKCMGSISQMSLHTLQSVTQQSGRLSGTGEGQLFSAIGMYRGRLVAIKKLSTIKVTVTRPDKVHFQQMRDLQHENLNPFIGICLDERFPCVLSTYCAKGSVQDIIEHEDIKLDWMFKISLLTDMTNLLEAGLEKRNDTNIVLLEIQPELIEDSISDVIDKRGKFWTAPEILRSGVDLKSHLELQKADIYSYGIVLWEILHRNEPYDTQYYTPKEIVERIRVTENPPYRPDVNHHADLSSPDPDIPSVAFDVVETCVEQVPEKRPNIEIVKSNWNSVNKGKRVNIVDNMVCMLERYANNLEDIVELRTSALIEERKKSDTLLYRMLPRVVAEKLKLGQTVCPEMFESVTIYFSDIVGFTSLAGDSSPMEIVDLLNDLYTRFDFVIAQHNVYKVETIGDAYMVASGLPIRNKNRHVMEIANMALDLLTSIFTFRIRHQPDKQMLLRIGLHTGPCAAGVVGLTMPRYCLFGDTVNMASRMESTGEPLKIHVSEDTYQALTDFGGYRMTVRGNRDVKGKGMCTTYWLLGKACPPISINQDNSAPNTSTNSDHLIKSQPGAKAVHSIDDPWAHNVSRLSPSSETSVNKTLPGELHQSSQA